MKRKVYGAVGVKSVDFRRMTKEKGGVGAAVGLDVGKFEILVVCRWADASFERPWRVKNPTEIPELVRLLKELRNGRQLRVALEPSGTYGDAMRQALADAAFEVQRVGTKAAHDYAEVFDGVPSQHDGKDAAVVAELTALGKSSLWPYQAASEWEQELTYWVDWMVTQRQIVATWQGRLEGLLGRHWPEATRTLKLSSATLLRVLEKYGSPQAVASDPQAATQIARWGGRYLEAAKVKQLVESARQSTGVRAGAWDVRQIREYAGHAWEARQQGHRGERRLRELGRDHAVLQAQGKVIGVPTACVLWVSTGDPRAYHAAGAYRKAMGLNLVEHSSGTFKGQLHISKRGSARSRQWLYFAALRLIQTSGVRPWYEAKKARGDAVAKRALVAVMRKLVVALYHIGVHGQEFRPTRLFARIVAGRAVVDTPVNTKDGDGASLDAKSGFTKPRASEVKM